MTRASHVTTSDGHVLHIGGPATSGIGGPARASRCLRLRRPKAARLLPGGHRHRRRRGHRGRALAARCRARRTRGFVRLERMAHHQLALRRGVAELGGGGGAQLGESVVLRGRRLGAVGDLALDLTKHRHVGAIADGRERQRRQWLERPRLMHRGGVRADGVEHRRQATAAERHVARVAPGAGAAHVGGARARCRHPAASDGANAVRRTAAARRPPLRGARAARHTRRGAAERRDRWQRARRARVAIFGQARRAAHVGRGDDGVCAEGARRQGERQLPQRGEGLAAVGGCARRVVCEARVRTPPVRLGGGRAGRAGPVTSAHLGERAVCGKRAHSTWSVEPRPHAQLGPHNWGHRATSTIMPQQISMHSAQQEKFVEGAP